MFLAATSRESFLVALLVLVDLGNLLKGGGSAHLAIDQRWRLANVLVRVEHGRIGSVDIDGLGEHK